MSNLTVAEAIILDIHQINIFEADQKRVAEFLRTQGFINEQLYEIISR